LGCVYKLVDVNGKPKIKLSQDVEKVTMPGRKNVYRLYSSDGHALIDLLLRPTEEPPAVGSKSKRAWVTPSKVESLYSIWWKNGKIFRPVPTLDEVRETVQSSLKT
ncbi:Uncharacterized protein FKW44_002563, partial [Caligus rogercresseyi]